MAGGEYEEQDGGGQGGGQRGLEVGGRGGWVGVGLGARAGGGRVLRPQVLDEDGVRVVTYYPDPWEFVSVTDAVARVCLEIGVSSLADEYD